MTKGAINSVVENLLPIIAFATTALTAMPSIGEESNFEQTKMATISNIPSSFVYSEQAVNAGSNITNTGKDTLTSANDIDNYSELPTSMKSTDSAKIEPPKHWDRALPFYGQRVIELGHDLPYPIGVSFIYATTSQNMDLYDLSVQNQEGGYVPVEFVPFENNSSESATPQIKLDAWLFPFMNVFGSVGKVSGDANVSFSIDGDALLDQLGVNCSSPNSGFHQRQQCKRWEGNSSDVYSTNVNMEGKTYTVGTVLAAGWDNYFVSIPISFTKMKMDDRSIDGTVVSASPRLGKVIPFQNGNSLAVYIGASYMDNELRITGSQQIPGSDDEINYQISQRTADVWEPIVGANYTFNKEWSAFFEITGSSGGRQQLTGGINRRF
ncbi:hypothetical protein [Agarivorans aestuarii]|uniref:hypothetical protein n=1 Tax=Agarivorans aestuarii TaxID=1563703 RepID=UPI001C81A2A0|nr:hypothetical protein [Agarivorans aestuarii]